MAKLLLRQRVEAGFRDDPEIAGQRDLEADAEAVAAIGGDHRLAAARGAAMFQASLETCSGEASRKPLMLPPLEKCSPDGAQHDHAHAFVLVERLEDEPQLIALRHRDDVERRTVAG